MKNILFSLSILLGQPMFCQAQRLGEYLNNLVAPLDKTEINSGYLWDKGALLHESSALPGNPFPVYGSSDFNRPWSRDLNKFVKHRRFDGGLGFLVFKCPGIHFFS